MPRPRGRPSNKRAEPRSTLLPSHADVVAWELGRRVTVAGLDARQLAYRTAVDYRKIRALLGRYVGESRGGHVTHDEAVRLLADPALAFDPAEVNAMLIQMRRSAELSPREEFALASPSDWNRAYEHYKNHLPSGTLPVREELRRLHPAGPTRRVQEFWPDAAEGALTRLRAAFVESLNHNLRSSRGSFIGHERDHAELRNLLTSPGLVTLWGAPGVGKSRLASEAAISLLPTFADGIWRVELAGVGAPALVPSAVARTLRIRDLAAPGTAHVVESLRAQHLLLLLDNCDHLAAAAATICTQILSACPRVSILATSRQLLDVSGEVPRHVLPLQVPLPGSDSDDLRANEAVRLFIARVHDRGGRVRIDQLDAVGRICQRLAGLPLGIELIAAQVTEVPIGNLARTLDEYLLHARGPAPERGGDPRHVSLDVAIALSFDRLPAELKRAFLRLSVFRGGARSPAIPAVLGIRDEQVASERTRSLVRRSLVELEESFDGLPRYVQLEPLREFAAVRLRGRERHDLATRHAKWFLEFATRADEGMYGERAAEASAQLAQEHDNLVAALDQVLARKQSVSAYRFGAALWTFWHRRGLLIEAGAYLDRILRLRRPTTDRTAAAATLRGAGTIKRILGQYDIGFSHFQESLRLARMAGNPEAEADTLLQLANAELDQGRTEDALAHMHEARDCYAAIGDEVSAARAEASAGPALFDLGRYREALETLEKGVRPLESASDRRNLAVVFNNIGLAHLGLHDSVAAEPHFRRSISLFHEFGDRRGEAIGNENLGLALDHQSRFADARDPYRAALNTFAELRAPRSIGAVLDHVARHVARFGRAEAFTLAEGAAKIRESLGATRSKAAEEISGDVLEALRTTGSADTEQRARALGRTLDIDQLVAVALSQLDDLEGMNK